MQTKRFARRCAGALVCAVLLTGCAAQDPPEHAAVAQTTAAETTVPQTTAPQTTAAPETAFAVETEPLQTGILSAAADIALTDTDGQGTHYRFSYGDAEYSAVYTPDNWKIIDSWKITVQADITLICEALSAEHPIHGADMVSYRDAEDLAFEWVQHNLAYQLLGDDSPWKKNAADVDLNPADQGKTVYDLYRDRLD